MRYFIQPKKQVVVNRRNLLALMVSLPMAMFANSRSVFAMLTGKAFKVKAGQARFGASYKMKGVTSNQLDIKISARDTEGQLSVFEQTGQTPHGGPPLHIHPHQDEWFYVLQGEYLFQVGEERFELKEGDTIFLPRQVPHAFIQLTEKARVIVSYLPAGKMEAFFKATNEWTHPPTSEEIHQVFAEHDMKVVGPGLRGG